MSEHHSRVCPIECSRTLDNRIRRWLHNPKKILRPYINEGMTVLDIGCGPGVFTVEMAKMVGPNGRVFACDLQEEMLAIVKSKVENTDLAARIAFCKSEIDDIRVPGSVDFILVFYVAHEVIDQDRFFMQLASILKPKGRMLIIEPPLHVTKSEFMETVKKAALAGFRTIDEPRIFISKSMLMERSG